MNVIIDGASVKLTPDKIIGEGGEAEVYTMGNGLVAKIFKQPNHLQFKGNSSAQHAAERRITEHQNKLKAWPKGLPGEVIGPKSLVTDTKTKMIVGYTMQFLTDTEALLRYGMKKYRNESGIGYDAVVPMLADLAKLIAGIHASDVVIGDFNDLNVLVNQMSMKPFLVDADSMQFGSFLSRVYTPNFVDPLICDTNADEAQLTGVHSKETDWYAYAIMLMQTLLYVGPYQGIHTPKDVSKRLKDWVRVKARVTIFSPEVMYPKPALHYSALPLDLLHILQATFTDNKRGVIPEKMVRGLTFTTCPVCAKVHARTSCPDCQPATPVMVKEVVTGNVNGTKVVTTPGQILYGTVQGGRFRYVYHESGAYMRDGAKRVIDGKIDPTIRVRIFGDMTVLAKSGTVVVKSVNGNITHLSASMFRDRVTAVDSNSGHLFMIAGDKLVRYSHDDLETSTSLGTVLQSQTLVWVGEKLGFLFSRAGTYTTGSIFKTQGVSLGNEVNFPTFQGEVIDATTVFSGEYVWFLFSIDVGGKRKNIAYMFDQLGKLTGQAEAVAGDSSWLSGIHGKCATGKLLFAPTDDGIVRIDVANGVLGEVKSFPDTKRFVDSGSSLFLSSSGIVSVNAHDAWQLVMK